MRRRGYLVVWAGLAPLPGYAVSGQPGAFFVCLHEGIYCCF